ncbi:DUF1992 domain-containing protein [uncultured Tateyamaria sp.]|uniref:DnaJ family domain-containing protein n=1 Tax=uncultured Tateyamaria sp. TaxID=455651 RepID=UPI00260344CD|nr:DUF1992 domain-containing protein [uncultured Tateyamaria sp.]
MTRGLRELIERQIQRARLEGQLDRLEGEGKPLPDRPEDTFVDTGDAVGFRMMAQAGVVPEEIEIKQALAEQRAQLARLTDPVARKDAMAELARLELRYNIAREARQRFMR